MLAVFKMKELAGSIYPSNSMLSLVNPHWGGLDGWSPMTMAARAYPLQGEKVK